MLPDGFGCIDLPGPSDDFRALGTSPDEDGCYLAITLQTRTNAEALDEYMDGYFLVDIFGKCLPEVTRKTFHDSVKSGAFKTVRVIEFEPD